MGYLNPFQYTNFALGEFLSQFSLSNFLIFFLIHFTVPRHIRFRKDIM